MVKLTNAIQSIGQYENLTDTFTPIPGISITIKAHTFVYFDFRCFVNANAAIGFKIRVDGFTAGVVTYAQPIFSLDNFLDQTLYLNSSRPDYHQWNPFTGISYFGELHAFGLIPNTEDFDQELTVSFAAVTPDSIPVIVIGGRMSVLEDLALNPPSSSNNFTNMSHCNCCITAELSCCQEAITINTMDANSSFQWKITDFLGGVYTGTMETDANGQGVITIGDGLDLPAAFLDVPGNAFKLEFIDTRPRIGSKMDCIEIDVVGGAYLALQEIGEPLP